MVKNMISNQVKGLTEISFTQWQEAVTTSRSIVCAGLDPKYEMRIKLSNKKFQSWMGNYLKIVAPYVAGIKPNTSFFAGVANDFNYMLNEIEKIKKEFPHLYLILDTKASDIGKTNDERFVRELESGLFDAVTFSQYPGNMKEGIEMAAKYGVVLLPMCLMSNPEYESEKNNLTLVDDDEFANLPTETKIKVDEELFGRQYSLQALRAKKFGAGGVVVGCTGHIQENEVRTVVSILGEKQLLLVPGVGLGQGGDLEKFPSGLEKRIIVNIGTGLMYPNGIENYDDYTAVEEAAKKTQIDFSGLGEGELIKMNQEQIGDFLMSRETFNDQLPNPVILASGLIGVYYNNTEKVFGNTISQILIENATNPFGMAQACVNLYKTDFELQEVMKDYYQFLNLDKIDVLGAGLKRDVPFVAVLSYLSDLPIVACHKPNSKGEYSGIEAFNLDEKKNLEFHHNLNISLHPDLITEGSSIVSKYVDTNNPEINKLIGWIPFFRQNGFNVVSCSPFVSRLEGGEVLVEKLTAVAVTPFFKIDSEFLERHSSKENLIRNLAYVENPQIFGEDYISHSNNNFREIIDKCGDLVKLLRCAQRFNNAIQKSNSEEYVQSRIKKLKGAV